MADTKLAVTDSSGSSEKDVKLNDKQLAGLKQRVQSTWELADAARRRWLLDKQEGLQLYFGIRRQKDFPFPGCANLHVPLIRTICDTLHSNLMGSIDTEKPVSISPVGPEDVPLARKAEKLLNWQLTTQVAFDQIADRIIHSTLVFGTAPVKVRYVIEKKGNKKIFDGLKVDVLPPERFLTPPDAPNSDVDEMEYVIQEIPMSRSDIQKRIESGDFNELTDEELKKLGMLPSRTSRDGGDDYLEKIRDLYTGVDSLTSAQPAPKYATVLEWYGTYDIDDDGIDETVMVSYLKESRTILRVVPWDQPRPFVIINFSEVLHRSMGESVPDLLCRLNQELNTIHNQRVDAVTIQNIPFFFFDPAAGFNPNEVKLTPGLGIPVNGSPTQAVYFPNMQTSRPEMYREEDNIFLYAERMLGAGANTQGINDPKRQTATEVAAVDHRAGIRFLTLFNRIKKGMRDIFKLCLELDKEYLPPAVQVRISGVQSDPMFEQMRREDLLGEFDITVNGNSIVDDQAEKQEMMQAYQMGMMNPIIMRDEMAVYELTRDLFLRLGVKRVDSYLRKPDDQIPKSPVEEHNLFLQEQDVVPNLNEDVQDHLDEHAAFITGPRFKLLSKKGQELAIKHYNATTAMQSTLQQLALVQKATQVNTMLLQSHITGQIPPGAMGLPPDPNAQQQPGAGQPPTARGTMGKARGGMNKPGAPGMPA